MSPGITGWRAITSIKIDGVLHEFSTIPGVREDVSEIILNLKQVRIKFLDDDVDEVTSLSISLVNVNSLQTILT